MAEALRVRRQRLTVEVVHFVDDGEDLGLFDAVVDALDSAFPNCAHNVVPVEDVQLVAASEGSETSR